WPDCRRSFLCLGRHLRKRAGTDATHGPRDVCHGQCRAAGPDRRVPPTERDGHRACERAVHVEVDVGAAASAVPPGRSPVEPRRTKALRILLVQLSQRIAGTGLPGGAVASSGSTCKVRPSILRTTTICPGASGEEATASHNSPCTKTLPWGES